MKKGIIVNLDLCVGCQACYVVCKQENFVAPNIQWLQIQREEDPQQRIISYFRMGCMHCDDPACLPVCPVKAISKGESGEVLVDSNRCIACGQCLKACPWDVPLFNRSGKTSYFDRPALFEPTLQPHQQRKVGRAEHCTLCNHRSIPACVEACHLGALKLVDYDHLSAEEEALVKASVAMNGLEKTHPKVRYVSQNEDVKGFAHKVKHLS